MKFDEFKRWKPQMLEVVQNMNYTKHCLGLGKNIIVSCSVKFNRKHTEIRQSNYDMTNQERESPEHFNG